MGWDGAKPAVTAVDLVSGAIHGAGSAGEVKLAAKEIFATPPHDIIMVLKFDDIGTFNWLATYENRNQAT